VPPPMIVLIAKLEVCHDHADFSTGHNQNKEHNKEESKDVVVLVAPQRVQNEVKLNKHSTEGQQAAENRLNCCVLVPVALWEETWDLVWLGCVLYCLGLVSDIGADKVKGQRDTNVKSHKRKEGSEGNAAGRMSAPNEEVEEQDNAKDDARDKESGSDDVVFPVRAIEHLVETCGDVSREESAKDDKNDDSDDESAAVCRAQKTQNSAEESDAGHDEEVGTFTNKDREQSRMTRSPENISVDQFPSLFFFVFTGLQMLRVHAEVSVERAQKDSSNHAREEQDDHDRVENGEPVDRGLRVAKVLVPAL